MHRRVRLVIGLAFTLLTAVDLRGAIVPVAIPASTRPDFNGDGKDDLAVGVPGENTGAGGVHIIYGAKGGLTDLGDQFFTQNSPDIPGSEEDYDRCGTALTTGDFNGDGYADLAFGCPSEDTPASEQAAGAVIVLYGSSVGLKGVGSQFWSQNSPGISGGSETLDRCGSSLAGGDINRDGFADLVWGCPGEDVDGIEDAGAVNVLFGSAAGLTATGNRFLSKASPGLSDDPATGEACGTAVGVGDFNGDGFDDVAAVSRGATPTVSVSLANWVLYGFGPPAVWHYSFAGGVAVPGAGDFNGDRRDDLVAFTRGAEADVYVTLAGLWSFGPSRKWNDWFAFGSEVPMPASLW